MQGDALADADQRARGGERAVVADLDLERVGGEAQAHLGAAGAAVLERGGERVLDDAVGGDVEAGGQLALLALDAQRDRQAGGRRAARQRARRGAATAAARA